MACQAHAVACIPCQAHVLERHYSQTNYHKSFQAPIGWFIKRLLGAFVKAVSRHALSSTCHGMSSRCCGMPCAHVLACQAVSWRALSSQCRGMPCQAHVEPVSRHALSSRCRAMSSRCCGMPCAHVLACQAVSWRALSSQCRGMPCQAHVEPVSRHALSSRCRAMSSRCCGMPCAHVLACQAVSWHPLSSPCPGMHALSSPSRGMCSLNYFLLCSFKNPNCSQLLPKCFQVPKSQRPKSPRALVP